jgi:hypothetical protein
LVADLRKDLFDNTPTILLKNKMCSSPKYLILNNKNNIVVFTNPFYWVGAVFYLLIKLKFLVTIFNKNR